MRDSIRSLKELVKNVQEKGPAGPGDSLISRHSRHSEESLESTRRLLETDPANRELRDWYAFMLYCNGRYREALEHYERLERENPEVLEYHYYCANCLYALGRIDDAVLRWQMCAKSAGRSMYGRKAREKLDALYQAMAAELERNGDSRDGSSC